MADLRFVNATVLTPDGPVEADVALSGDTVESVDERGSSGAGEVIDLEGAWLGPGFVDLHTHLREPGQEWKEDIGTGSAAAAAGGFTAVVAMPNTEPPIDAGHLARHVAARGREVGLVDVAPAGTITAGRAGERLSHLDELWDAGVRIFTDDGDSVADAGLLRRAMEYLAERGGVVSQHAVDGGLCTDGQMHEGEVSSRLGMTGIPVEAEEVVVSRDMALARLTGVAYHVQHLSAAAVLGLVRAARVEGLPVTCEVTPHHLAFDHSDVLGADPVFKMMPPLRTPEDVTALREALADGHVDAVATDHAPHAAHEKDVPWEHAPFGVTGLETAAAVVHTVADLDPVAFYERMAVTPARIARLDGHGRWVEPGAPANLVVFDPSRETRLERTHSRSVNSPFLGRTWHGTVRYTVLRGRPTFADGKVQR